MISRNGDMFTILKQGNAISNFQIKKEVSKKSARDEMQGKMKVAEVQFTDPWYKGRVDVNDAMKNYKNIKRDYDRTCPETLSPQVKNEMWKKAKILKDEFVVGMLSRDELHPIKSIQVEGSICNIVDNERMLATRSVERNTVWYQRNENKIHEFKNIMRHLCPEDVLAGDIERYRPSGGHG